MSLISVNEAHKIIRENVFPTGSSEIKNIQDAYGYVLFEDVISPINMPPFRQSAMDGYAIAIHEQHNYTLLGEIKAGDSNQPHLTKGEAVRIFTGAAVPDSANAVVIQEKVLRESDQITVDCEVHEEQNIRSLGEQVRQGELALKKGTKFSCAGIGYLASLGITEVKVFKKPSVSLVVTGNELVEPGQTLGFGKIYESNAIMLGSVLQNLGYNTFTTIKVEDNYDKTLTTLKQVINESDFLLISGGISVGDYDFVGKALLELGVEQLFYKVRQKPGKPLFFGKTDNTIIFALPGNPGSALSCFYNYAYPALELISGNKEVALTRLLAKSESGFIKRGDRAQFLKASYHHGTVKILEGQNSSMLHTFALANALAFMPENMMEIKKGDEVELFLIPKN